MPSGLTRRSVLALVALGILLAAMAGPASAGSRAENLLPGTPGWDLAPAPVPTLAQTWAGQVVSIDGYADRASVAPGETLDLHVGVAAAGMRYRVQVDRLGWYGGVGARQVACLPSCGGDRPGVVQPAPPAPSSTGLVAAGWSATDALPIGADWPSGYYIAQLVITAGARSGHGAVGALHRPPRSRPGARRDGRGPGEHLAGLQQLGRQEPLRVQQHAEHLRLQGLLRPPVVPGDALRPGQRPGAARAVLPVQLRLPARPIPRARGARGGLRDRRGRGRARRPPDRPPSRHRRGPLRVLDRGPARRPRRRARRGRQPLLPGRERRLLAGAPRGRRADPRGLQGERLERPGERARADDPVPLPRTARMPAAGGAVLRGRPELLAPLRPRCARSHGHRGAGPRTPGSRAPASRRARPSERSSGTSGIRSPRAARRPARSRCCFIATWCRPRARTRPTPRRMP